MLGWEDEGGRFRLRSSDQQKRRRLPFSRAPRQFLTSGPALPAEPAHRSRWRGLGCMAVAGLQCWATPGGLHQPSELPPA